MLTGNPVFVAPASMLGVPAISLPVLAEGDLSAGRDPEPPSAHEGPQMRDERARFRRTPAMGRRESVDRLRQTAPSGERLDERAALEIIADQ
jgi:hypothetical protein